MFTPGAILADGPRMQQSVLASLHHQYSAAGPVWPPSVSQLLLTAAAGAWQWRWPHSAARSKLEKWCELCC